MDIDFDTLTEYERYKLMASLIVPRPIAVVTTLGPTDTVNAAPFSLFNMIGEEPPLVMISLNRRSDHSLKDTAINIVKNKEFVVHMTDEQTIAKAHQCGVEHPPLVSEVEIVGFTTIASSRVKPPRIAELPVAFECTLYQTFDTASRQVFFGQVHRLHVSEFLIDKETWRVRLDHYFPVGRFGANLYVGTKDRFVPEAD